MTAAPSTTRPGVRRGFLSATAVLLAAVLFVAVNVIVNERFSGVRLDLTQDKLYTLSAGTLSVLSRIDEPVTLRFYLSEKLTREIPSYGTFATRIREMLQEYETHARGKVRLEIVNPLPFSDEEDRAVAAGIQGVPVDQSGELVYFGLAGTNTADKEEVISFFQPERERFLEYDLTKLVYNLATTKKKVLAVLSGLPLWGEFRGMRQPSEPWAVYTQLQQFFEVRRLEPNAAAIGDDVSVLMIAHPQNLPDATLYAIDQFVLRGGRVLAFVDPHAENEMTRPGPAAQTGMTASNLKRLFDAWGVELVEGKVAGDLLSARRVNAGTESRVRAVDYVAWLTLREANFNRNDVLTAELSSLQFASTGILRKREGATTEFTPLIRTSQQSMEIDADAVKFQPDPASLLANFKPSGQEFALAARIQGTVKTAFPDGPPPAEPAAGEEKKEGEAATPAPAPPPPAAQLKESREPVNLIVIADTDVLEDRFWVQSQDFFGQRLVVPVASNGDFVVNAVDNLLGSNELIGLRGRGLSVRPFALIQDMQREAELKFRAKERELTEKVRETERKLSDLQSKSQGEGGGGRAILTREQQEAIDQFRTELVETRRELRGVQRELRADIDSLQTAIRFLNIAAIPILIGLLAIVLGIARVRRRRPRAEPDAHPAATTGAQP